jgi:hypothetical protein
MNRTMAETPQPFSPQDMARRKRRAMVMAAVLLVMVALFFVTTLVRFGGRM